VGMNRWDNPRGSMDRNLLCSKIMATFLRSLPQEKKNRKIEIKFAINLNLYLVLTSSYADYKKNSEKNASGSSPQRS